MDTAANAGIESVGVTWGFRPVDELRQHNASHIIDTPDQLLSLI
jgi:phosphoglycolate phosphatase